MAKQKNNWYIGIDVGGTKIQASLCKECGVVVASAREATPREGTADDTIKAIVSAITKALEEEDKSIKDIAAVGIAVPGVVDPMGNVVGTPNMNLGGVKLKSLFAKYPRATAHSANDGGWIRRKIVAKGGRWLDVLESEDFIANAADGRVLPWRIFMMADSPSKLCEADIVYALAEPAEAGSDFSWVRPGKVAWDWWNAFDNKGDPEGCTTAT